MADPPLWFVSGASPRLVLAMGIRIPVDQGIEIALAQRNKVNHAGNIPREEAMTRFYASHPEWAKSVPLPPKFH